MGEERNTTEHGEHGQTTSKVVKSRERRAMRRLGRRAREGEGKSEEESKETTLSLLSFSLGLVASHPPLRLLLLGPVNSLIPLHDAAPVPLLPHTRQSLGQQTLLGLRRQLREVGDVVR